MMLYLFMMLQQRTRMQLIVKKKKELEKYEHLDFHESKTNSNDEPSRHVRW